MKKLNKFLAAMLLACSLGVAGCSKKAEDESLNAAQTRETYDEIAQKAAPEKDPDDPMNRVIDFSELQKMNPDIYAWIYIPGTNIDYPVVQSEDDAYYLNTMVDGRKSDLGAIYSEKYNKKDFSDHVNILYGHTVFSDTVEDIMFSQLHKYDDPTFFEEHPYVYIYTPDKTLKYQIFAAVDFDDRYILGNYQFNDPLDFQDFLDEIRSSISGNVNRDLEVTQESGMLVLSTCQGLDSDRRLLVVATEVEDLPK